MLLISMNNAKPFLAVTCYLFTGIIDYYGVMMCFVPPTYWNNSMRNVLTQKET